MDERTTDTPEATPPSAAADPDAFERLTMPYLADVARFARSLTRDAARSDDLVQETYLRALRGWHTFRRGRRLLQDLLFVYARDAGFESLRPSRATAPPAAAITSAAPPPSRRDDR